MQTNKPLLKSNRQAFEKLWLSVVKEGQAKKAEQDKEGKA